ncbi:MAG: LPXTG cell wall anchor domain-containing protein [Eubacteriales bacterium]|nr:LPXTG cell wall anchor domain-containing protein [Eubacteriales bacterium]
MMKKRNKVAAFLTAWILTTLCLCQAVFAAQTAGIDTTRNTSLTLDFQGTGKRATINLFRVGEWDGSQGKYVLTGDFASSGAQLDCPTANDVEKNAETLMTYAEYIPNQLKPLASLETVDGKVSFSGLTNGVYLFYQKPEAAADNVVLKAFLVRLPSLNVEGNGWVYDVTSYPKYSDKSTPTKPGNGDGGDGGSSGGGGGGRTITTIPSSEVPMGGLVPIDPQPVPLAPLPKTGDTGASTAFYMSMMLLAGVALLGIRAKKQK